MSEALLGYAEAVCVLVRVLVTQYHTGVTDETVPQHLWQRWHELHEVIKEGPSQGGTLNVELFLKASRLLDAAYLIICLLENIPAIEGSILKEQVQLSKKNLFEENMELDLNWAYKNQDTSTPEEIQVFVQVGVLDLTELTPQQVTLQHTEKFHAALDFLAFQWCMGLTLMSEQGGYSTVFLDHYFIGHVDLQTERHYVPVNVFLPATMRPIQGGTPFQKLRRLVAAVRTVSELAALHANWDSILVKMEEQLGVMPVDLVQDFMVASRFPPKNGARASQFYDWDPYLAEHFARSLQLRERSRFEELPDLTRV